MSSCLYLLREPVDGIDASLFVSGEADGVLLEEARLAGGAQQDARPERHHDLVEVVRDGRVQPQRGHEVAWQREGRLVVVQLGPATIRAKYDKALFSR